MKVRMLNPEKLGQVHDVPDEKAADLIARGMAEVWVDSITRTTSDVPMVTRGPRG